MTDRDRQNDRERHTDRMIERETDRMIETGRQTE